MRTLRSLLLALAMGLLAAVIGLLFYPGIAAADRPGEGRTARMNIEEAYETGQISYEEMILLKSYMLYRPDMLPETYRTEFPEPCGTPIALEVDEALRSLDPAVVERIDEMRARPVCTDSYDTEHFRIHYDTTGTHMISGWPDTSFRDAVAAALEFAWDEEVDTLGFRPPPSDATDPDGGGGSAHYDVYLQNLSGGLLGYCQGTYYNAAPGSPPNDATGYIVMDKDYLGFGWSPTTIMRQTAIHEFCHACQFAHDVHVEPWYMECTSVWAQEQIEDSVNMYRSYLHYFLGSPYLSINEQDGTGMKWYGSCVWNIFLSERYGSGIVPAMWYALEGSVDELTVMNTELGDHASSLAEEYEEFATWNWFTGARDDGLHYEEGSAWTQVAVQKTVSSYPVIDDAPAPAYRPNNWGCNYVHLNNPGGAEDQLEVSYDGPQTSTIANVAGLCSQAAGGSTSEIGEIPLNAWGNGNATVDDWDTLARACLIVMNTSSVDDMVYTFSVDKASPVAGIFYGVENGTDEVTLRWSLADPSEVVSLALERATSTDGDFVAINDTPLEISAFGLYLDTDVRPGDRLWYRLVATDHFGETDLVEPGTIAVTLGESPGVSFAPVFPNPASATATLEFTIPYDGARAALTVYDASGRTVARLTDRTVGAGRHSVVWNGRTLSGDVAASGHYFCVLTADGTRQTRKLLLVR